MFHDDPSPDATAARSCHAPYPVTGAPTVKYATPRGQGDCDHADRGCATAVVTKFNCPRKSVSPNTDASRDALARLPKIEPARTSPGRTASPSRRIDRGRCRSAHAKSVWL